MTKYLLVLAALLTPAVMLFIWPEEPSQASAPICIPACPACYHCFQPVGGQKPVPPICIKNNPTPTGCP